MCHFYPEVRIIVVNRDRYTRLIARINLSDGRDLSEELVRAGLVWWEKNTRQRRKAGSIPEIGQRSSTRLLARSQSELAARKRDLGLTEAKRKGEAAAPKMKYDGVTCKTI